LKILLNNRSAVFLAVVILYLGFSSYARLQLPAFWDEPKIYLSQLYNIWNDASYHFTGPITVRDRPPGLHLLYFPWMALFGDSLFLIRALSLVYFSAGLALFYGVIARQGTTLGMLTVALFVLTPIVQVYAVQYVGDPQLFFLFALYVYLLGRHPQKWGWIALVGFLAGLTREPALALIPATLGYLFWRDRKLTAKGVLLALTPLMGLSVHMLRNLVRVGTLLNHHTVLEGHLDLLASVDLRLRNIFGVFLATYRLLPLFLLALVFIALRWRQVKLVPLDVFAILLVASYFVIFSGVSVCLPRYVLPAIPFLIYLLLRLCVAALSKYQFAALTVFVLGVPLLIGNPNVKDGNIFYRFTGYQDTLEYPQLVKIHQEALLKTKAALQVDDTVQTAWPFMEMLRSDKLGYGPMKKLNVTWSPLTPPEAILWTNFPEQIPHDEIEKTMQQGEYESQTWRYEDYVVELHLKKRNAP